VGVRRTARIAVSAILTLVEKPNLVREWTRLLVALTKKYGTADLNKQRWTVENKVYDITYPDQ
jgi:hypothetical protein